jgi:integrase
VPDWYRDLYDLWFRVGWRPSELLAVRFDWLDFHRQTVHLKRGRIARWGGVEAPPKTGEREVDCSYDPAILGTFERLKRRSLQTGRRDFVFSDEQGNPLSQEWLHKRVWLPTLRKLGLRARGQYNIRDTFITLALSAGEDPGWVA